MDVKKMDVKPKNGDVTDDNIDISSLPEKARKLLSEFDKNGDGFINPRELKDAAEMLHSFSFAKEDRLPYNKLPDNVKEVMKAFDTDASGAVDLQELAAAAVAYKKSQEQAKTQQKIIFVILAILVLTIGAITGLTFAVVELSKETKASSDGTLKAAGSSNVVKVASVDSNVNNGVLQDRISGKPLATRMNLQSASLSSLLPNSAFKELKYFEATSTGGAYIYVKVNGFVKLPPQKFGDLPIVKMLTPYGTITLQGTQLSFADTVPEVFLIAGFTAQRRMLQGVAQLVGWFELLEAYMDQNAGQVNVTLPVQPPKSKTHSRTYVPCGADCEINDLVKNDDDFKIGTMKRHGTTYKFYTELGYTYTTADGVRMYRAEQVYERFPDITVVDISNGTHSMRYQEYNGNKYHCQAPVQLTNNGTQGTIDLTFIAATTYTVSFQSGADSDTETLMLDAKAFQLTSTALPNVTSTYYGHETNIDHPIAISLEPEADADGKVGPPVVFTEFFGDFDTETDIDPTMFDLNAASVGCRSETGFIAPPDVIVHAVGDSVMAADPSWGTQITETDKQAAATAIHDEIATNSHYAFNESSTTSRRSLNTMYPIYPYYATADGCTHTVELSDRFQVEFTHHGRTLDNLYSCEGPIFKMTGVATYPPVVGLIELAASVQVAYDTSAKKFNAEGCMSVGLACDNTLRKYGLGAITNPICKFLVLEGHICALADYHKVAECQSGVEHYWIDRYGWWYCARWSWGRCRSWRRHHWRERRTRPTWRSNIASNYRLGVSGRVAAGFDVWIASAYAEAKIDYFYIDARHKHYSGNYMAIYISISATVGWSRFSSGFQLLPWKGDASCNNGMMVWDKVPFKKLG